MANVVAGQVTITGLLTMGVTTDTAGPTSALRRGLGVSYVHWQLGMPVASTAALAPVSAASTDAIRASPLTGGFPVVVELVNHPSLRGDPRVELPSARRRFGS